MSEEQYLAQQAADAREALTRVMHSLGATAQEIADPREWAQRHPWLVVGGACLLGALLAPSPGRVREGWRSVRAGGFSVKPAWQALRRQGWFRPVRKALWPILRQVMNAGMAAAAGMGAGAGAAGSADEPSGNGHARARGAAEPSQN